jgi:hypothetical protein
MKLEPYSTSIEITDSKPVEGKFRWAHLHISLQDQETECCPAVEVRVLVPSDHSLSIGELRTQAADHAKTILREVLSLLEEHGIERLAELGTMP